MIPTTISGVPKTITKTIELMRSLPQMAGEAFRGFIRIVEYSLYHLLTKFVRDLVVVGGGGGNVAATATTSTTTSATLAAMRSRKTPLVKFYDSLLVSLKDWILNSSSSSSLTAAEATPSNDASATLDSGNNNNIAPPVINSPTHSSSWYSVFVASESLDFLLELIRISRPVAEPLLPAVERATLVTR